MPLLRLARLYESDVVDIWTPNDDTEENGEVNTSAFFRTLEERLCDHHPLQAQDKVNALLSLDVEHEMFYFALDMFDVLPMDSIIVVLNPRTYWRVSRPARRWNYPEGHWDVTGTWLAFPPKELANYYAR